MKSISLFLSVLLARSVVAQSTSIEVSVGSLITTLTLPAWPSSGTTGITTTTVVVSTRTTTIVPSPSSTEALVSSSTRAVSVTISTSSLGYTISVATSTPAEVSSYLSSVLSIGQSSTAPSTTSAHSKTSSESASATTTTTSTSTSTSLISISTTTTTLATSAPVSGSGTATTPGGIIANATTSQPAQFTGGARTASVGVSGLMGVVAFCLLGLFGL